MVMVMMVSKAVTVINKPPSEQGHDLFSLSLGELSVYWVCVEERRRDDKLNESRGES